MSFLRVQSLLLWWLLLISCGSEEEQFQRHSHQDPSQNQYKLVARAGIIEERFGQENREIQAGDIIPQGATIHCAENRWSLIQDDKDNLLLVFPQSQVKILTEITESPTLELMQGNMALYCESETHLITGNFQLVISPETELQIELNHIGATVRIFQGQCRIVWMQGNLQELDQWFQLRDAPYPRMWQDSQSMLQGPMTFSWEHQWFRDQSITLGKLMGLPRGDEEQGLSRYFNNLNDGPEPQEFSLEEEPPHSAWFSLLQDRSGVMNYNEIRVEPIDAMISYKGILATNLLEIPLSTREKHLFSFHRRGYENGSLNVDPTQGIYQIYFPMTQRSSQTYSIEVNPPEAEIYVNGHFAGKGRLQLTQNPGEQLELGFELEDHITQEWIIEDLGIYPDDLYVELRKSVQGHYYISSKDLVGISFLNGYFIVADRSGNLTSVRAQGGLRPWGLATSNYPNDWSSPVIAFNRIYFSGRRTLIAYDPAVRETIGVRSLNYRSLHQYGRRVVPFGQTVALPTSDSIILLSQDLSSELKTIVIPGGSMMTPLAMEDYLYTVGNDGRIFKINRSGLIESTGQSRAFSPMGGSMVSRDYRIFFCDRKGLVTAFHKETLEIIWDSLISVETPLVFRDIHIDQGWIYVYSEGVLFPLSEETGDVQSRLPYSFLTPPWIENGLLYGCFEEGFLHIIDLENQEVINRFELSGHPTSPVYASQGMVAVGMDNGRMLIINQPGWVPLQESQYQ